MKSTSLLLVSTAPSPARRAAVAFVSIGAAPAPSKKFRAAVPDEIDDPRELISRSTARLPPLQPRVAVPCDERDLAGRGRHVDRRRHRRDRPAEAERRWLRQPPGPGNTHQGRA